MRHFVYFPPCIAILVAVAVPAAVTTLMYLSPLLSSLIVSSPRFCPPVLPCSTLSLPGSWRGLITLCLVYLPSSTDPHLTYRNISLSARCTCPHLDCLLHPSSSVLYSVIFLIIDHRMSIRKHHIKERSSHETTPKVIYPLLGNTQQT